MQKLFLRSSLFSTFLVGCVGCATSGTSSDPSDAGNSLLPPPGALEGDGGGPFGFGDAAGGGLGSTPTLVVTIRDFKFWKSSDPTTNPDFENVVAEDKSSCTPLCAGNIVAATLGPDHKPVYKSATGTTTTHGKGYFDQWYNDVQGANIQVRVPLPLTTSAPGTYGYDSQVSGVPLSATDARKMWFPIDDRSAYATAFGNQGLDHNYSFTTELHTVFVYKGGESFAFSGDDDVFVFIDGKLVIDLGGVHAREQAAIQLDSLGLVKGQQYPLDLFGAERHTLESNLSFTTTLFLQPPPQ
jgi:fibro-slime domain-containing protein